MGYLVKDDEIIFDGHVNYASKLLANFDSEDALALTFTRDVADVIIEDLLFDPHDEST